MLIRTMNGTLTHNKGYIQAFATDPNGMRSFYFDSRTFYIEKLSDNEDIK
jgi:hypothetical protein